MAKRSSADGNHRLPMLGGGLRRMRLLYNSLGALCLPFVVPLLALHPRLRGGLRERLGRAPELPPGGVWYHGASAGDVNALLPLARRSVAAGPVLMTSLTRSGAQLLAARLGVEEGIVTARSPLDLPFAVESFFARVAPRLLVLECLELWPNLHIGALRRGVPVALMNARLSPRSLARYRRLPALFGPLFAALEWVVAIDEEHAGRFCEAGVDAAKITVSPSTKHGGQLPPLEVSGGPRGPVVLGSVHMPEIRALLPRLLEALPHDAAVFVAPRYPRAAKAARDLASALGWPARLVASGDVPPRAGEVAVLDRVGGLHHAYRGASAAFVGGSLIPHGGHNVMEPAAVAVPVVVGPHVAHCRQEVSALEGVGAASVVRDAADAVRALLRSREASRLAGEAARRVAEGYVTAAADVHQRLLELLSR